MVFAVAAGYWVGAVVLWLPLALMLRRYSSAGMASVLAGLVLSAVWPVSLPIVGGLYAVRHVRRRPIDATETALAGI